MGEYLTNLPPSIGWFRGGNWHKVFHLVTHQVGDDFVTLCGAKFSQQLAQRWTPGVVNPTWLCKNCLRILEAWRRPPPAKRGHPGRRPKRGAMPPREELEQLYQYIADHPGITRTELADALGWTWHTVNNRLDSLERVDLLISEDPLGGLYPFESEEGSK